MKEKLLITGGNGMFATSLKKVVSDQFEILCMSKDKLDITNEENVKDVIENFMPNYIIHTAALTNVDLCEKDKELALKVNTVGTENIAKWSDFSNSKLVYISSCGLFGDEVKPYSEDEKVVLKTEYAKSKYYGEKAVEKFCEKYYIVRPGWLFGGSMIHKKNFVYNRYIEAMNKSKLFSAIDKYGCPTYTLDLANKIIELLSLNDYGVYHISNTGSASRYDYVKKIVDLFKLKVDVEGVDSSFFPRSAPVPNCEIIENKNLKLKGIKLLPSWEDAIERYVSVLKKELNIV